MDEAERSPEGAEQAEWDGEEPEWDEDESAAVVRTVGKLIKLWRKRADLTQLQLGSAIGYSVEQVSSVERGRRVPQPEFLVNSDEVLGADGIIAAMQQDVAEARCPKKVRDLAKLEAQAVELGAYSNHVLHGLLQTEEYARALYRMRRPAFSEDRIDRYVAGRMSRQQILEHGRASAITFVLEEVTLHRPIGGREVLRRQLERLLEIGKLRHVEIQVMPTDREEHAGMGGGIRLLKLKDGTTLGYTEDQVDSRVFSDAREVHSMEMRYGIIRSQALTPRESLALIDKVLGET
ncbi:helix-turn-helix domain-containing protein [Streptomyces marispadix]|uniref:Helix-turn-helix transcriptional regulator n=1 Tax=Streptomyces marispadix TaxID=2922868 RepID=A0ABS9T0D6_9ACTN|nr:helix-turn-helix transcriptional regulator [Streptomyces marispadix]MCH6161888.1 helix-turn-helix transcriptional regulator [Streptomyces marispadix]